MDLHQKMQCGLFTKTPGVIIVSVRSTMPMRATKRCERSIRRSIIVWVCLYAALIDDVPVGWVSSIDVGGMTWCANMFVKANFRRFGIAKALMCKMLRDDRKYGSQLAVLIASHVGAMLYPIVGYSTLGTLLVYTPRKK